MVRWHRISPWARGSRREALSALVGAALTPALLFLLALPFGGVDLAHRAAETLVPSAGTWVSWVKRAVGGPGPGEAVVVANAAPTAVMKPVAAPTPTPRPTPRPTATPAITAAHPKAPTRFVTQAEVRLGVPLAGVGLGVWRHRTPDELAMVELEIRADGGCQLQLTTDTTRLVEAPRTGAGYRLIDTFIARFMPPEAGATPATRLTWWRAQLAARQAAADNAGLTEVGNAWNPTFNLGGRVGQALLQGREFTLLLSVPPEDPGL